jgi:hypothetical protein
MVGVAAASKVLRVPLGDIEVFSLGTGAASSASGYKPVTRMGWGIWLIEALLSGASDKMHDYFVKSLPLKKYERHQFARESGWQMDNTRCMYLAEKAWAEDIQKTIVALRRF